MLFLADSAEKCETIFNAQLCNYSFMAKQALERCPHTCGLCDKNGAGGSCSDLMSNCDSLVDVIGCSYPYLRERCMKTCEIDNCFTSKS